jgi:hypothetical protein
MKYVGKFGICNLKYLNSYWFYLPKNPTLVFAPYMGIGMHGCLDKLSSWVVHTTDIFIQTQQKPPSKEEGRERGLCKF